MGVFIAIDGDLFGAERQVMRTIEDIRDLVGTVLIVVSIEQLLDFFWVREGPLQAGNNGKIAKSRLGLPDSVSRSSLQNVQRVRWSLPRVYATQELGQQWNHTGSTRDKRAMRCIITQCELISILWLNAWLICANATRDIFAMRTNLKARMLSRSLSVKIWFPVMPISDERRLSNR